MADDTFKDMEHLHGKQAVAQAKAAHYGPPSSTQVDKDYESLPANEYAKKYLGGPIQRGQRIMGDYLNNPDADK